ncbi:MAG: BatD family protein [Candidatus Zhuqueibacterota bacterium]
MMWILVGTALPEDGSISLEAKVDKNKIKIGDLVRFSIIISRDKNVNVQMPELGASLGAFEIRDYVDPAEQKINGQVLQKREYTISTYDIGEYEIPPVRIFYSVGTDTALHELSTEKITITVESVKPSEAGDIRDIKNPLEIPRDWWQIIRIALAGLLILLIFILAYIYYRRWKEGKSIIPRKEKPKRPPHEIALEELNALVGSDLLARGEVKQFYISISEIIRRYIGDRYYIFAIEMTTPQLIDAMNQADIDHETTLLLENFLVQCDLVKFAKYFPEEQETEMVIQQAFDIVEKTKIALVSEEIKQEAPGAVPAEPTAPVDAGQESTPAGKEVA